MLEQQEITIYGNRLKSEAKKHGLKNQDMADLLGFADAHQISPIYSGKKKLSDDRFKILADKWGYREDYLRCIDDFPTDDDVLKHAHIEDKKAFDVAREYLASLGITFESIIRSHRVAVRKLYDKWNEVKPYLSSETISNIQTEYDFSLSTQQFHKKYFASYTGVRWIKPFDDIDLDYLNDIGKNERIKPKKENPNYEGSFDIFLLGSGDSKLGVGLDYYVDLKMFFKGKYLGTASYSGLQSFMQKMDKYVLFLASDYFNVSEFME